MDLSKLMMAFGEFECLMDQLIIGANKVRFIKSFRLEWAGHVRRMSDTRMTKRVADWNLVGRRTRSRSRKRWLDDVENDLRMLNVRRWRQLGGERAERKKIVGQAKSYREL